MTLNVYAHLWPDEEDRTRRALDDLLGSADGAPRLAPQTRSRQRAEPPRRASPAQETLSFDLGH